MQTDTNSAKYFPYIFLVLFALTQFPLYWVDYPDIADFFNHLARLHILTHLSESEALQHYYTLRESRLGTNLAMELVVPLLSKGMSLILALKVFTSLSMFFVTSGAAMLGRVVQGKTNYLLLGVLLFTHNAMLQLGLLNYLFGLGLAFWLLSAWVYTQRHASFLRIVTFSLGCVVLYICHLSAFGVYALCVLAFTLGQARSQHSSYNINTFKALLPVMMQFVPVIILHVMIMVSKGSYIPIPAEKTFFAVVYSWITYKLSILALLPSICISGYFVGPPLIIVLIICSMLYVGFRENVLKLSSASKWMASVLAVSMFVLPFSGFGSSFLDVRLVPAFGLILWAGLEIHAPQKLKIKPLIGVITLMIMVISGEITRQWQLHDQEYSHIRSAMLQIPVGAKVATVILNAPETATSVSVHVSAFSVIDRSTLLSNMFIWPFQPFWIAYHERYIPLVQLARLDGPATYMPEYKDLKKSYDYVLVFGGNDADRQQYAPDAITISSSAGMAILKTKTHPISASN